MFYVLLWHVSTCSYNKQIDKNLKVDISGPINDIEDSKEGGEDVPAVSIEVVDDLRGVVVELSPSQPGQPVEVAEAVEDNPPDPVHAVLVTLGLLFDLVHTVPHF